MKKILFVPLNTNHVLIFQEIINSLRCDHEILCHDKISEAEQYHTESALRKKGLSYIHFSKNLNRSVTDNSLLKIIKFFKMKREVKRALSEISPDLVVLAMDNDPIAQTLIKESKKQGIKTALVQEALVRPLEYTMRKIYLSDYIYNLLRTFGIYLNYTQYGTGNCDKVIVGGKIASDIMKKRGVPEDRIAIVGQLKYDTLLKKIKTVEPVSNEQKIYLFAASTKIIQDNLNVRFLHKLANATNELGIHLIVKLHPRASHEPSDIYNILNNTDRSALEVVKEGDDTFEILKRSYALITVSSTVVLEALLMNKECITVNYLAGESSLEYGRYDAVHSIESAEEIYPVLKASLVSPKAYHNKRRLLEDELYKLDAKAGQRAATEIEGILQDKQKS